MHMCERMLEDNEWEKLKTGRNSAHWAGLCPTMDCNRLVVMMANN